MDSLDIRVRMRAMAEKYKVNLSAQDRAELASVVRQTSAGVARVRWAKILLLADQAHPDGRRRDWEIAEAVGLSERQVVRIRQKFVREGAAATLTRATRSDAGSQRVLDGSAEAHLIHLACSTPPDGRDHWTLELLCDELCRLQVVRSACRETVRRMLKKTSSSPGGPSGSASAAPSPDRPTAPPAVGTVRRRAIRGSNGRGRRAGCYRPGGSDGPRRSHPAPVATRRPTGWPGSGSPPPLPARTSAGCAPLAARRVPPLRRSPSPGGVRRDGLGRPGAESSPTSRGPPPRTSAAPPMPVPPDLGPINSPCIFPPSHASLLECPANPCQGQSQVYAIRDIER